MSVKGLEPEVVARLAEQARREGVSAQEWMRQALRRTAALLTPGELNDRVAAREVISEETYEETMASVTARRAARTKEAARAARSDVRRRRS